MGEATTGSEAVALVRSATPDMVLMDIRMPGMGGIEATRRIVGAGSPSRILVLTTFDLDHHVTAGERLVAPAVADRLIRRFLAAAPTAAPPSRFSALSARELDVFVLVARGMSNDEIAQVVVIGRATVKTHVSRILTKLGARDRVHLVVRAYEGGLVSPGEDVSTRED